jgi:hypothetical protein
MGLTATASGGGSFTLAPAGTSPAVCTQIIDLGTQVSEFSGEKKSAHKVLIGWEIAGEVDEEGKPVMAFQRFTVSLHEKATLRKTLAAWRNRDFTEQELAGGFSIQSVLGAPCMLSIVHIEKAGKKYANIQGVMSLPKGMPKPTPAGPLVVYDIDKHDQAVFDSLGKKLQEKIASSPEFRAAHGGQAAIATNSNPFSDDDEPPFG